MAKFREFYVQAGAGSNFLASKCLWGDRYDTNQHTSSDTAINEFYFDRENTPKILKENCYECDDDSILSEAKRMTPILIELDIWLYFQNSPPPTKNMSDIEIESQKKINLWQRKDRRKVINNINELWRKDWSMYTSAFFEFNHTKEFNLPQNVKDMVTSARDYFGKSREYYYNVCEQNEFNSFLISHNHPFDSISSLMKLPKNLKTLGMELDPITEVTCRAYQDIKSFKIPRDDIEIYTTNIITHNHEVTTSPFEQRFLTIEEMEDNRSLKWCDDSVSYRKIFFENDRHEIMKMYEFFDNKAYFHKNRVQIMKEFKEYHDNNMAVIERHTPTLYKQITDR